MAKYFQEKVDTASFMAVPTIPNAISQFLKMNWTSWTAWKLKDVQIAEDIYFLKLERMENTTAATSADSHALKKI